MIKRRLLIGKNKCHTSYEKKSAIYIGYACFGAGTNYGTSDIDLKVVKRRLDDVKDFTERELIYYCNRSEDWVWWNDVLGKLDPFERKWSIQSHNLDGTIEVWD